MKLIHQEMVALVPRLRRYARGLTNDIELADDLVQDCLARALDKMDLWEEGTNLQAWMFTIMRNLYMNDLRKQKRWWGVQSLDDLDELPGHGDTPDSGLYSTQIMSLVTALPVAQREVLLLVAVEGLSYAEVAEVLDIPIGTVMSRIHRARKGLVDRIEDTRRSTIRSVK
ncbi:MAG: sigma-70 family RNA polymerase sigma factor [Thiotrichales bacterium]